ncbi:MAG TPA: right-handed parallel beta-helix repeat-containing protein [Thermoplasmata archaeon]|nr:right-handed parallel beta-helix repeat-containing protein [Thermoplasmata archaeon]
MIPLPAGLDGVPRTGPLLPLSNSLSWSGNQVISSSLVYRNTSIALSGGNLVIAAGGSLLLDNASLSISEVVQGTASALSYGITVQSGGTLTVKDAGVSSANGAQYPTYLEISGGAHFLHVGFNDLGGTGSKPTYGKEGITVRSAHVTFEGVLFDHTYQLLFTGTGAIGDQVDASAWADSTITGGQVGWVQVSGGASWTNLTHDSLSGGQDAGMLALVTGPHVTISNTNFYGDPSGTQSYQVYLTYDGWSDKGTDASHATFVNNRLQTANLGISDGAYYTVEGNTFNDSGHWGGAGGQAALIVVTWLGSGVGQWTRHLTIEGNTVTNFTHYALRISQNVSDFNVSNNRIFATESTYSPSISEADGIYLIRGVNNGTVWNNAIDMTDRTQPSDPTNGVVLEAQVNDVNVSGNRIYNCSEVGITVQGDSGALSAPKFYLGPSLRNTLYANRIINFHNVSAQTMYSSEAIETWMWANSTRVADNYIQGWGEVNVKNYWNGAAFLTSSADQTILGNTIVDARFGFVFEKFDSEQELRTLGSFNRSNNVIASNTVSKVSVYTLVENARDDMGPIVNVLSGPLDPSWTFWFSGSNATLHVVGGGLTALSSGSPYRLANIRFVGAVELLKMNTTFDLQPSQWTSSSALVTYGAFQVGVPLAASEYDVQILSYGGSNGTLSWSAYQSHSATDSIQFTSLLAGVLYLFLVDGKVASQFTPLSVTFSLTWSGSGSHAFALAL